MPLPRGGEGAVPGFVEECWGLVLLWLAERVRPGRLGRSGLDAGPSENGDAFCTPHAFILSPGHPRVNLGSARCFHGGCAH